MKNETEKQKKIFSKKNKTKKANYKPSLIQAYKLTNEIVHFRLTDYSK
jgi:hypothetical protein